MIGMPGKSYRGELPPLTQAEIALQVALKRDIETLAIEIGDRNSSNYSNLNLAADFLTSELTNCGYKVKRQGYEINQKTFYNLEAEIIGTKRPDEIIIIGGHYDSVFGCPGANDNGTGAAAVLELARAFANKKTSRTLRFVEFVNEEPPFFMTDSMGSLVYAKSCQSRHEKIVGMLSLETIGYYSDKLGSQNFPIGLDQFYPSTGDYITFIGNLKYAQLVYDVIGSFRRHTQFPSEGAALPQLVSGVSLSDHWSFWEQGYPALMVTDTAMFRYPYYHTPQDTPDKIQFDRLTRVVAGLERVIDDLAILI